MVIPIIKSVRCESSLKYVKETDGTFTCLAHNTVVYPEELGCGECPLITEENTVKRDDMVIFKHPRGRISMTDKRKIEELIRNKLKTLLKSQTYFQAPLVREIDLEWAKLVGGEYVNRTKEVKNAINRMIHRWEIQTGKIRSFKTLRLRGLWK